MTEKAETAPDTRASPMDPLLLACARVTTSSLGAPLTNASGFLFEHGEQLFLVSSRHVFIDEPSKHFPDRIEVEVHTDAINASRSVSFTVPLYRDGKSLWRQATDSGGEVDVAAIELDLSAWPEEAIYHAFSAEHLADPGMRIDLDTTLLIVGFPLGFHDVLHHLPVVRHAGLASCYGMRFQGQGCFLTDARTHRGISGAPVVTRAHSQRTDLGAVPWVLLGVHSARFDASGRDVETDEALGLNCAWYADILLTLVEKRKPATAS
jgi:hypothetical protein